MSRPSHASPLTHVFTWTASCLLAAAAGLAPLACAASAASPSEGDPRGEAPLAAVDLGKSCLPGETRCDGACVFLSSDLDNCGACGFSCAGGSCSVGVCKVASGTNDIQGLTAHGGSVYFTEIIFSYPTSYGTLSEVSITGGKPSVLATIGAQAAHLVADASGLYFTDFADGSVSTIPLSGGSVTPLATGQSEPMGLALSPSSVYWANYGNGTIMAVSRSGGGTSQIASGQGSPWGVALHDGTLFWSNYDPGSIVKLHGTTQKTLTTTSFSEGLVVSGSTLIWAEAGSGAGFGSILSMPIAGGSVTTLASGLSFPVLAADATYVYWVDTDVASASVERAPIGGGAATVLATGQSYPVAIAVDGDAVVWATSGAVMKVASR